MSKKWNLQDIQPIERTANRRTVSEQPVSRPTTIPREIKTVEPIRKRPSQLENETIEDEFEALPTIESPRDQSRSTKGKRYMFVALGIFVFSIIGAYSIGNLTGGAEITIYPKVRSMNVNADFTAYKENRAGELSYEILTLEATGERQVTATGQEEVSVQTVGEITIYKTTPGDERLIKNTRFATADGKVFRIQESVVIPGASAAADGGMTPGAVKAEVFADAAGEEYNLPAKTRLTVPGFAESNLTALFDSIYAENLDAFTGGYNGPRFIIDEAELASAQASLQSELRDSLNAKVASERPAAYTVFLDSTAITYTSLPPTQQDGSLVTIKEQATLRVPIFNNEDFASFIARETIVGYEASENVRIDNINEIAFSYSDPATKNSNIADQESLDFKITGQPVIVWTYEEEALKEALVGKEKTALSVALGQYSQESRSSVKIKPFWKRTFPEDIKKISITEVLNQE